MPVFPTYPGVYIEEVPSGVRTITGVATSITAFLGSAARGPIDEAVTLNSYADFERTFGGLTRIGRMPYAVRDFFVNGGTTAIVVRLFREPAPDAATTTRLEAADYIGSQADSKGMYALQRVDLFNLLCIPPYKSDDSVDASVLAEAAALCERRRAMLLVDPAPEWADDANVISALDTYPNLTSKNAALYFPRLRQPDPLDGDRLDSFAPCGAVAGVFARTDATRGVWKAPAGLEAVLLGVSDLSVELTDRQNGNLGPLGVNCLRTFPVVGSVVWGARTLRGADRLADTDNRYVPVRRLTLFIEESLYRGTQFAVFEPNGAVLWGQLRLAVGAFMQSLFNQGAFAGKTAPEAFFVKCDNTTTTQVEIDMGEVVVEVGFAPLKPAEFVVLRIQQSAGRFQA